MTRSVPLDVVQPTNEQVSANLAAYSRFVQRLHRRYADWMPLLSPGAPTRSSLSEAFEALLGKGLDTAAALRVLRQLTMERLLFRVIGFGFALPLVSAVFGDLFRAFNPWRAIARAVAALFTAVAGQPAQGVEGQRLGLVAHVDRRHLDAECRAGETTHCGILKRVFAFQRRRRRART